MTNDKKEDVNINKIYGHLCKMSKEEFISKYKIKENGLQTSEVEEKLHKFGYNEVTQTKPKRWYHYLFKSLFTPFNSILLGIALVLSYTDIYLAEDPNYANIIVILVLVAVSTFLDFFSEFRSNKAAEKLKQNGIENNPELALKIGVAAMKFGDLQNSISKDYIFDFDKFCAFEGKTGPYLQYNAARIQSLLKKANEVGGIYSLQYAEERDMIVQALKLLESYETALQDNSLAPICNAVYNLASSFATYYNNVRILTETNTFKRKSSLTLCEFTYKLIAQALHVLAIDIPEKM